jgi:hypothetical protein
MSSLGPVGWGGGQPTISLADQPPAPLVDRPMMRPAQQRQPGKTQPLSRTARAVRWAACTTRVARPTSSGWVGEPPRAGGSSATAARSRSANGSVSV